jgi:hypothetical protein
VEWHPHEKVEANAVDTPVVGYKGKRVNTLRLWTANALDPIRLDAFNAGDHAGALAEQVRADALVRVLYPADSTPRARNCACVRNISSRPPPSRTSCAATRNTMATCAPCPTRRRSSSTTRTRAWPWPN